MVITHFRIFWLNLVPMREMIKIFPMHYFLLDLYSVILKSGFNDLIAQYFV